MANNVPQAPQRPDVPEQNLQLSGDVFIPAQVSAGQVPVLDRSELKLPSDFKVFWMLLKVQITMIWTTRVANAMAVLEDEAVVAPFINFVNELVRRYRQQVFPKRKKKAESTKTENA